MIERPSFAWDSLGLKGRWREREPKAAKVSSPSFTSSLDRISGHGMGLSSLGTFHHVADSPANQMSGLTLFLVHLDKWNADISP